MDGWLDGYIWEISLGLGVLNIYIGLRYEMVKEKHTWKQIIGLDLTNILNTKLTWFNEQPPRL